MVRERSAKPFFTGSNPVLTSQFSWGAMTAYPGFCREDHGSNYSLERDVFGLWVRKIHPGKRIVQGKEIWLDCSTCFQSGDGLGKVEVCFNLKIYL